MLFSNKSSILLLVFINLVVGCISNSSEDDNSEQETNQEKKYEIIEKNGFKIKIPIRWKVLSKKEMENGINKFKNTTKINVSKDFEMICNLLYDSTFTTSSFIPNMNIAFQEPVDQLPLEEKAVFDEYSEAYAQWFIEVIKNRQKHYSLDVNQVNHKYEIDMENQIIYFESDMINSNINYDNTFRIKNILAIRFLKEGMMCTVNLSCEESRLNMYKKDLEFLAANIN